MYTVTQGDLMKINVEAWPYYDRDLHSITYAFDFGVNVEFMRYDELSGYVLI